MASIFVRIRNIATVLKDEIVHQTSLKALLQSED